MLLPINVLIEFGVLGAVLLATRVAWLGRRLLVASVLLLAVFGFSPLGNLLLYPLEQRFPPWDATAGAPDGIIVLGGYIHNNPANSVYADQLFAGVVDRGFWAARPQDAIALLSTYNTVSGQLGNVQAQELQLGLPLSNGATGVQTHEMLLEVNYNVHVWRGVSFQPDFQYVMRPNAQANIHNAAVFGFRAHVWF